MLSGGTGLVLSGGHLSNSFISSGGVEILHAGGAAVAAEVGTGGVLKDLGFANSTTIDSGGSEIVGSGGTDRAATVDSGGKLTVLSGGTAIDTTIASGSTATVMAGGILAADAGGTAVVSGTVANAGKLLASAVGGLIDIVGVVNGGVTVIGNGTVEIAGSSSENVSFLSNGHGVLKLDGLGSAFTGKITGFGGVAHANHVQFIDFTGVSDIATVSFTSAASHTSGTLTVNDGTHSASVTLVGHYVTSNFGKVNDGSGHLEIDDPTTVFAGPPIIPGGSSLVASNGDIVAGAASTLGYSANGTGGALAVSDGTRAATIALLGNYMAGSFVTAADGHGGTLVAAALNAPLLTTPHP
jgi:autotransporter passenger strand-loop-strand repeat protein